MKRAKQLSGLLLALVMVLALAVPAMAAEGGGTENKYKIIISNPGKGDIYKAYKIFDVTYNPDTDPTAYSYTIKSGSAWWNDILAYMSGKQENGSYGNAVSADTTTGVFSGNGLTLTPVPGTEVTTGGTTTQTYVVEGNSKNSGGNETKLSAAEFAEYLAAKATATGSTYTANDTGNVGDTEPTGSVTISLTPDEPGYYLVTCLASAHTPEGGTTVTTALAELTTTAPTATITDKNAWPLFDKKQTDTVGADNKPTGYTDLALDTQIGDTVYYQITDKVPNTKGYTKFDYTITDTLTEGLTLSTTTTGTGDAATTTPNVEIKVGTTKVYPVTSGTSDWTVTPLYGSYTNGVPTVTEGATTGTVVGFQVSVDFVAAQTKTPTEEVTNPYVQDADITITYSATVNEKAVYGVETNTAKLVYSNDPADPNSVNNNLPEEKTDVYNAAIEVVKYDDTAGNVDVTGATKLAGAEFVLYKTETTGEGESAVTKTYYYKYTAANGNTPAKVDWTETKTDATVMVTDANGKLTLKDKDGASVPAPSITTTVDTTTTTTYYFGGLEEGTYYLLETAAPRGYNLLNAPVTIKLNHDAESSSGANDGGILLADETGDDNLLVNETTKDGVTTKEYVNAAKLDVTVDVGNKAGTILPDTGGIGTTVFYVVGGILVAAAVVLLITRRRVNSGK